MEFLPYSNQVLFPKNIPLIGFRQVPPLTSFSLTKSFPFPFPVDSFVAPREKQKVVFVLGSTGTGKSKLAINIATHFDGEIVNSDKIQVHDGLNIITNKVTEDECAGIPHHLIGGVHPHAEFTASDFRGEAMRAIESVVARGHLAVVAGGSNSYIEELVDGEGCKFRSRYDCCFIWVNVDLPVLNSFVSERVDKMVEMGLVEEARGMFNPDGDYSKGIRKAIGVPEMDSYFRAEGSADEETKERLLKAAIDEIKANTCKLAHRQLQKIQRLSTLVGWDVRPVDATDAFLKQGKEREEAWDRTVRFPTLEIVHKFLHNYDKNNVTVDVTPATKNTFLASAGAGNGIDGLADTAGSKNYGIAGTAAPAAAGDVNNGMTTVRATTNYCGSASTAAAASVATAILGATH